MNLINSKHAQAQNYLIVIIFLMVFGFFNIVAYTVWLQFLSVFESTEFNQGVVISVISDFTKGFQAFDYIIVLLMIIFIIGTALTAFKIATNTAFFIVTFIMAIFWGFVSYFFNYVFIQLVSPSIFATAIGAFPRTILLCTNLHWVMLAEIIVGSIALYGKKEKGQFLA